LIRPASQFFVSDFLREVYVPSRIDLAPNTIRQMEITLRVFQAWAGRELTLSDLTEDLVRQFLAAYRAMPRSAIPAA
jgi:site-specific recombinase XerD